MIKKFQNYKDELNKLKDIESEIMIQGYKLIISILDFLIIEEIIRMGNGLEKMRKEVEKIIFL